MKIAVKDPLNIARAQHAYWSRKDIGDPVKAAEARRTFELIKLERHIKEVVEDFPLTPEQRATFVLFLVS